VVKDLNIKEKNRFYRNRRYRKTLLGKSVKVTPCDDQYADRIHTPDAPEMMVEKRGSDKTSPGKDDTEEISMVRSLESFLV